MHRLILIKHSAVQVRPGSAPETWPLSPEGQVRCEPLAQRLEALAPDRVITSAEPKAAQTGQIVAERLGLPIESAPGLHEHVRTRVPHMASAQFISMIELMFRRPDERVLGEESASDARNRFAAALDGVVKAHRERTLAVVTHGTVLALFVALHNPDQQPFALWRSLQLPSFVVLSMPDYKLIQTVARLE
jgi:broad specificity phosphatase PhoE